MAVSLPLGLQQLVAANEVMVKQRASGFHGNKYVVANSKGDVILAAKEDGDVLTSLFGGKDRSFHMKINDMQDNLVFSLRRPYTFGTDKMEVTMNGVLACIVRQQSTWMTPILNINDANDFKVLRIKGEYTKWDFTLETSSKQKIGTIKKKYKGFLKEAFTDLDTFYVQFPADLDVRYKAAVIGSCVLIDFLYHEN